MKLEQKRVCIYPKDVQRITGRSNSYARILLRQIRKDLNKQEHQFITVDEFCAYTGLQSVQVLPLIVG
jgi:hypothetical protein